MQIIRLYILILISVFFIFGCTKGDDASLLKDRCLSCHNLIPVCLKLGVRNYEQWKDSVIAMRKAGARLSDTEVEKISRYLTNQRPETVDFCK
ncbi:MAG: hypothetical protein SNJ53_02855 [Thermodesulfovibrionales bacterium]